MLNRPFKSAFARAAIFALVLALAIPFVSGGLTSAQEADPPPCTMVEKTVTCTYDENGDGPVADFSALDPEGESIVWRVLGTDKALFEIEGGVLTFNESPNYERPLDKAHDANDNDDTDDPGEAAGLNTYEVIVRASETLAENQDPPARFSDLAVTVTVQNVEEPGSISLNRVQPQAGTPLIATLSDPDSGSASGPGVITDPITIVTWTWSVPKVSRPVLATDAHWTAGGGEAGEPAAGVLTSTYTPDTDSAETDDGADNEKVLRVKVTYTDQAGGAEKTAYKLSYRPVRPAPSANQAPTFDDTADFTANISENASVGTAVGAPVTASDPNADVLSYELAVTDADATYFKINIMTGQITVAMPLDHENGSENDDGVYELTVTAYDPSNAMIATGDQRGPGDDGHVTITATNVNEAPKVTLTPRDDETDAPDEVLVVDEKHTVTVPEDPNDPDDPDVSIVIGTYGKMDEDIADGSEVGDDDTREANAGLVKLSLAGDDADAFVLDEDDSQLRFKKSPNFEMPIDANQDNAYEVTVLATDTKGLTGKRPLMITVENIDEVGTVGLSTIQPAIGQEITATLTDPDGRISDMKWQWYSSSIDVDGPFSDAIDGATSPSYTPQLPVPDDPETLGIDESDPGDEGNYLQARVTYRDAQSIPDVKTTETYEEGRRGVDNPNTGVDSEGVVIDDDPDTTIDETVNAVGEAFVRKNSQHAVRAEPDVNNAPEFAAPTMMREVNEDETVVGEAVTADDADGDSLNYTLTGGADMGSFTIDLGSGQIKLKTGTELDFEGSQTSYEVEVKAEDPFGKSDTTMVTIRVLNVNEKPDFMPADPEDKVYAPKYDENGTGPVATFTATDPEGAGIDWSLKGADARYFNIDANGVLTFKKSPDFEKPLPVGDGTPDPVIVEGDNNYEVTVQASEKRAADAEGETKSSSQEIIVTVQNVEEPGSIGLNRVQPQTGVPLTAILSDDDIVEGEPAWEWSVPKVSRPVIENNAHWTAVMTTTAETGIYEPNSADVTNKVLRVRVKYNDGEGDEKTAYMLSYNAVRPAPTANNIPVFPGVDVYTRSIREDAAIGAVVGAPIRATDANAGDAGKLTYILGGANLTSFKINTMTGQLTVGAELDHEAGGVEGVYTVEVTVWDPSDNATSSPFAGTDNDGVTKTVTITVADVNEAPTVTVGDVTELEEVDENHAVVDDDTVDPVVESEALGTYDKTDPDVGDGADTTADASQVTLSLSGDDAAVFELSDPIATGLDNAGARELRFKASPDYESPVDMNKDNAYKVIVVATDKKGLTGTQELTITVINVDEKGTVSLSTIQPGIGQEITAKLSDLDGGETGARWQWSSAQTEDELFERIEGATSASYTPKKTVPDNLLTEDVDEGVIGDEGMYLRATVTYRDAQSDPDDELTTTYEEGRRGIDDPSTGVAETALDPAVDAIGEFPVRKTSANAVREVPEVNRPPVFESASMMREVEENSLAGIAVGDPVMADDPDNDVLTYTRTGGADMAAFTIDSTSGQLKVGEGTKLDFEGAQTTYEVEVTAKDPFGLSDSTTVTITVTNVNEKPNLTLIVDEPVTPPTPDAVVVTGDSAVDYEENGAEAVATYTSSVADVTWSLSGDDADDFTISGGVLEFTSPPDWESPLDADTDNDYMVTVAATDGTTTGTVSVTVTVTDDLDEETTNGNGNGEFDPLSYDDVDKGGNENGVIDRPEVIQAIRDYFADMITQDDVTAVIRAYFAS